MNKSQKATDRRAANLEYIKAMQRALKGNVEEFGGKDGDKVSADGQQNLNSISDAFSPKISMNS